MNATELRKQLTSLDNAETNILLKYVDEETGEIDVKAFEKLEKLGKGKMEIISSAADSYHSFIRLAKLVNEKLSRLRNLEKVYKTTAESIKKILSQNLTKGEKIHTDSYMISWRKSTAVITDDFFDIETLYLTNPELVKITKELKKAEVKKLKELPEGIEIIEKQNIQVR